MYAQRRIDLGNFYASKDNAYPTRDGKERRINWGWATVAPGSAQTLPREITFNAVTHTLEQAPIEELSGLRGPAALSKSNINIQPNVSVPLSLGAGVSKQSEIVVTFPLPATAATFGLVIGTTSCTVTYTPPASLTGQPWVEVPVACGAVKDSLRLSTSSTAGNAVESMVELRVFTDNTFFEAYFQRGRVAMTVASPMDDSTRLSIISNKAMTLPSVVAYPMKSIWTTPDAVRNAPRVYPGVFGSTKPSSSIVV